MEQDWVFWAAVAAMAVAVAALLWAGIARGGRGAPGADMAVYRDQLAEIDRDLARGLIVPDEAGRLSSEVSRRLLAADRARSGPQPQAAPQVGWPLGLIVIALAGAVWGYVRLGAPGYPDLGLAARIGMAEEFRQNRPTQAEAEADMPAPVPAPVHVPLDRAAEKLLADLRTAAQARPDDLQGQTYLARFEAEAMNFAAAARAQARVIVLKGEAAMASDHLQFADLQIRAAGGYVSPEAEAALKVVLALAPEDGMARYYSGLMLAQTGRPDQAFTLWRGLLETSPPDAAWLPPVRGMIEDLAASAGVQFSLNEALGPTSDEIAAAAEMTAADRRQMIAGMVDQLGERLATAGGPVQDWARLITSLAVLGETDRARAILAEAEAVFATVPEDLQMLQRAAQDAGLGR